MDETRALEIMGGIVHKDECLECLSPYIRWRKDDGDIEITLDGKFSAEEIEAFAWWMRHKGRA